MQPNQDSGQPVAIPVNITPVAPVAPQPTPEPVQPGQPVQPVAPFVPPKKKSHGMLFGLIFAIILAIGGVGFGVWTMMNPKTDTPNCSNTGSDVDPGEYIYIGEWGLKIKVPEGLSYVSYLFRHSGWTADIEETTLSVYGTVSDYMPDFANSRNNDSIGLGELVRFHKDTYNWPEYEDYDEILKTCGGANATLIFSSGDYNFCYTPPQSVYSVTEDDQELETETVELIKQMLTNEENFSEI